MLVTKHTNSNLLNGIKNILFTWDWIVSFPHRRPDLFYHTANLSLKPEADPQRRIKLPPGVAPPPTVDGKGKKLPPAKTDIKGKKDKKVVPGQPPPSQPVR